MPRPVSIRRSENSPDEPWWGCLGLLSQIEKGASLLQRARLFPLLRSLRRSELGDELLEFSQAAFQLLHILGFRLFHMWLLGLRRFPGAGGPFSIVWLFFPTCADVLHEVKRDSKGWALHDMCFGTNRASSSYTSAHFPGLRGRTQLPFDAADRAGNWIQAFWRPPR